MKQQSFSLLVITLIVLSAILHTGEAFQCYQCNATSKDSSCNTPSDEHKINCPTNTCSVCNIKFNGTTVTSRTCVRPTQDTIELDCKICDTELCNNADALSINKIALQSLAMLWIARYIFTNSN